MTAPLLPVPDTLVSNPKIRNVVLRFYSMRGAKRRLPVLGEQSITAIILDNNASRFPVTHEIAFIVSDERTYKHHVFNPVELFF